MSVWSRVTLVGEQRTVDMVLPAAEPVGALMPDVLELLGDPVQSPPRLRHLVTSTGDVLDPGASLADRRVPDGAVLRLVRSDEPLPAPVVHEVPEVVGDSLDTRLWRWSPAAARWTATCAMVALAAATGLVLDTAAGTIAVAALAVVLLSAGTVIGMTLREPLGTALSLAGGGVAVVALWSAAAEYDWAGWVVWGGGAMTLSLLVVLLGLSSPLGRGALVGGASAALLSAIGIACALAGLDSARTGAVLALACVVLLSVVLRLALALSGLTSLDDQRGTGTAVRRADLMAALDRAHRTMVIATIAVAVATTVAGLGATARFDGWTAALAALLALVVAGRARVFPLVPQKAALLAAALIILIGLAVRWTGHVTWGFAPALGMLLVGLATAIMVLAAEPAEHTRARLRQIMNRIEAVAVLAVIPVAVGVFGTFDRLLDTF